jgi:hypothetical protein
MSSDLERRVRELSDMLREASEEATRRAEERALVAARRGRLRGRFHPGSGVALAVALLFGSGLGFALGTSHTSSGNAASAPVGVGFLPEPGWDVLQSGTSATLGSPIVSIAANVDLHADDDADGLPLSTLQTLRRNGVVIIASFTARGEEPSHDNGFPARSLPLTIREGKPFGIQLRPDRPLGQYEIRAAVRNHNVHIEIYLGTPKPPRALVAAAQRQLARLVVTPRPSASVQRVPAALTPFAVNRALARGASRVIDRTFACTPDFGNLDVVASPRGSREVIGGPFTSPGYARVTSGRHGDPHSDLVVAARPGFRMPSIRFPAAVYASSRRCVASRATVPLTLTGLPGPPAAFLSHGDCTVERRVIVRVRALLPAPATWGSVGAAFVGARGRLLEAEMAVRDERTRKPLALVRVGRTGKTKLWISSRCA